MGITASSRLRTAIAAGPLAGRRRWFVAAGAVVLAVVLLAIATAGPFAPPARQTVSGIVIKVEAVSAVEITAFTLRTADGRLLVFQLGRLDTGGDTFPAVHLREHLATAEPVLVTATRDGNRLTAVRLEDAPAAP